MGNKRKRYNRALAAKLNIPYQAADNIRKTGRRNMRDTSVAGHDGNSATKSSPGHFETVVWQTIHLVDAWRDGEKADESVEDMQGSEYLASDRSFERMREYMRNPLRLEVLHYLEAQSEDDIYKLIALMYAGRDDDSIPLLIHHVRRAFREKLLAIRQMMEKTPLAKYLRDGLQQARTQGIDLEGTFEKSKAVRQSS